MFAMGHSTKLHLDVWFNVGINPFIIDAIIGFSVICKALDTVLAEIELRAEP